MGNKRRRSQIQLQQDGRPPSTLAGTVPDPHSLSPRLPAPLTAFALLALYGWMLSWWKWFLYSFYKDHFQNNFRTIAAFLNLLSTLRFEAIAVNFADIAWSVAIFASALALGRMALDSSRLDPGESWGRHFTALGIGMGLLSLVLLMLGLAGLWTKPVMITLVALPLFLGSGIYGSRIAAGLEALGVRGWFKELTLGEAFGFVLWAAYLVMNFMAAFAPEHFYDSLVYHLAMPKLYVLHRQIVPTPSMIYSGIPFGTEMLYGLALALGSEITAKLLHYGFGVAIAAAIDSWCRRHLNRKVALLAVLLFYSAPLVCFASSVAKVELAMTLYLLLAVLLILEAAGREEPGSDTKPLLLSGMLAGFAFGTKYNAGLYVPVLALPLVHKQLRAERFELGTLLRQLALFFGSAAIVSAPWLLKNWAFYHNPTYPFLNGLFHGSASANVAGLRSDASARDIVAAFTTWTGFKGFLAGIWNPNAHAMDSYVGPALQIGLPWLFLARWKTMQQRGLFLVVVGIWLAWALHSSLSRFVLPAVPLFCILVASALWLVELPRGLRLVVVAVFYYTITIGMARVFLMLAQPGTWKVAYGRATKSDYLLHEHPSYNAPYYAGAQFINRNAPEDAIVLVLGEQRGYYLERKFITASVFDVNPMADLANSSADADDLLANLRREGITHLLVNAGSEHYHRWLEALGGESRERYEKLLKQKAQLAFNHVQDLPNDRSWVQVYKLADAASGSLDKNAALSR